MVPCILEDPNLFVCCCFPIFMCMAAQGSDTFMRARIFLRGPKKEPQSQLCGIKSNGGLYKSWRKGELCLR